MFFQWGLAPPSSGQRWAAARTRASLLLLPSSPSCNMVQAELHLHESPGCPAATWCRDSPHSGQIQPKPQHCRLDPKALTGQIHPLSCKLLTPALGQWDITGLGTGIGTVVWPV